MPVSTADRLPLHARLVEVLGQWAADTLMELLRPPEGWPDDIDDSYAAYDDHPIDSTDEWGDLATWARQPATPARRRSAPHPSRVGDQPTVPPETVWP